MRPLIQQSSHRPGVFRLALGLLAGLWLVIVTATANAQVRVFFTPNDIKTGIPADPVREHHWNAEIAPGGDGGRVSTIAVDAGKRYQKIEGIGGAFNEIGGEALESLPAAERERVLRALFDPKTGAGFSFCRLPIGASDFALDAYSYSETPDDFGMSRFSLARDEKHLIPFAKSALKINPALRFVATPWSPPAWMKRSGKMDGGGPDNRLRDEPRIYKAYALYFEKYIKGYADRGIVIDRVTIQNEPDVNPRYPGCVMPTEQMVKLGVEYLGPRFKAAGLTAAIWGGTFREGRFISEGLECMADERFAKLVGGLAVQYSKPAAIFALTAKHPGLRLMHTEGDCFNGDNSTRQGRTRLPEVLQYLHAGCTTYIYWNMILNEEGKSAWDWPQNCLINIDRHTGAVTYNPDYAAIYLCSRFIRPGGRRVHASSDLPTLAAFQNPDGGIVVLTQNAGAEAKRINLVTDGREMMVELPPMADVAIELPPHPEAPKPPAGKP